MSSFNDYELIQIRCVLSRSPNVFFSIPYTTLLTTYSIIIVDKRLKLPLTYSWLAFVKGVKNRTKVLQIFSISIWMHKIGHQQNLQSEQKAICESLWVTRSRRVKGLHLRLNSLSTLVDFWSLGEENPVRGDSKWEWKSSRYAALPYDIPSTDQVITSMVVGGHGSQRLFRLHPYPGPITATFKVVTAALRAPS
jgi:hypothetical protein